MTPTPTPLTLWSVSFEPINPVGHHLIIRAESHSEACGIASEFLQSRGIRFEGEDSVVLLTVTGGVVSFASGDY